MYFNSRNLSALTPDQINRSAPAVYANSPKDTTSKDYLFVPTHKIIEGLRGQGWEVVAAKQTMNRKTSIENRDSNKHALFMARADSIARGANFGDSLPLIKLTNAHNGLASYEISAGFFRVVCSNGLTVPDSIYSAPKVRHTRDMAQEVIDATYKVLNDFPKLVEMKEKLSGLQLSLEERLLFADAAADIFFAKSERDLGMKVAHKYNSDRYLIESQLTQAQRREDTKTDLWTISNVIQENMIRGNVRVADEVGVLRSKRKVSSIERDNDIHDKLFKLTQHFAKLKGVEIGNKLVVA